MTTQLRTLLHDAADAPAHAPDVEGALRRARTARRRRRGLGVALAAVVLAVVTGVVVTGGDGGDDARVAIGPRQVLSQIPDGWKTVHADRGVTLAVPPDWREELPSVTPIGTVLLSVDDLSPDADAVLAACTMHRDPSAPPSSSGSAITLWEFPGDAAQVPDTANGTLPVVARPDTFAGALVPGPNDCPNARYDQLAFRDADRVFLVRVVSVFLAPADEQTRLALAAQVLDTLRVQPSASTPTTTEAATATSGSVTPSPPAPPTVTAAPAFVPTTDDERAIQDLFVAWLHDHPDDETRAMVEDADALLPSIHEGLAQHSTEDLARYSGVVSSVRMLDPDHAEVQYTLLFGGQPLFGLRTGVAVRIDGRWMVSRATECSLLSLGGITCPAP